MDRLDQVAPTRVGARVGAVAPANRGQNLFLTQDGGALSRAHDNPCVPRRASGG